MSQTADEETVEGTVESETGVELELVDTGRLAEVLAGMTEVDATANIQQTKYRIVAEMLAAETEDELWSELPTWSSKDSLDESFEIQDVRGIFQSRYEDAETGVRGGFLACSAVKLDSGEVGIFTTSALRLAARIGWYYQHGKLPVKLRIVSRGESSSGYPILDGEKA